MGCSHHDYVVGMFGRGLGLGVDVSVEVGRQPPGPSSTRIRRAIAADTDTKPTGGVQVSVQT